jgi:hypothetical protein
VTSCLVFGIIAWVLGRADLNKMKRGEMDREGEALTRVGYILGIVSTLLWAALILFYVLIVVVILGAGAAAGR